MFTFWLIVFERAEIYALHRLTRSIWANQHVYRSIPPSRFVLIVWHSFLPFEQTGISNRRLACSQQLCGRGHWLKRRLRSAALFIPVCSHMIHACASATSLLIAVCEIVKNENTKPFLRAIREDAQKRDKKFLLHELLLWETLFLIQSLIEVDE